jgi:HK97 gp10 family phage protein
MRQTTHVRTSGFRELEEALSQLPKATGKNVLRRVGKKQLLPLQHKAEQLAPDDPATSALDLKRSFGIQEVKARRARGAVKYATSTGISFLMGVKTAAFHGWFQEWGTVNHAAHPFMRPTWDAGVEPMLEGLKDDLWTEIRKAAEKQARKLAKAG